MASPLHPERPSPPRRLASLTRTLPNTSTSAAETQDDRMEAGDAHLFSPASTYLATARARTQKLDAANSTDVSAMITEALPIEAKLLRLSQHIDNTIAHVAISQPQREPLSPIMPSTRADTTGPTSDPTLPASSSPPHPLNPSFLFIVTSLSPLLNLHRFLPLLKKMKINCCLGFLTLYFAFMLAFSPHHAGGKLASTEANRKTLRMQPYPRG